MRFEERIPDELFDGEGHYLGRPADFNDRIIQIRIDLAKQFPEFTNPDYELLEIGCGNGASLFGLSKYFKSCVGIEITDQHMDLFEKYKSQLNITNCEYTILDIEKNDPPKQFDRIISFEVIEHLQSEDSLSFYNKALKNGGLLAISVPNKWWIFETHGADLPLLPWNRVPFFSWLPTPIHERFANARIYTKSRIENLLKKHGFEIMQSNYVTAPLDVLPESKIKDIVIKNIFNKPTTSIPFKATSLFVVAKKIK